MSPIYGALEHDSVSLHVTKADFGLDLPDPPATEVINAAITLFAMALPLQGSMVQEGALGQLANFLSSTTSRKDPGRRAAVTINAAMALLGTLKVAVGETIAERGDLKYSTVEKEIEDILRVSRISSCIYPAQC